MPKKNNFESFLELIQLEEFNIAALKKAYHKASLINHPDRNPGDLEKQINMQILSAKYELLEPIVRLSANDKVKVTGEEQFKIAKELAQSSKESQSTILNAIKAVSQDVGAAISNMIGKLMASNLHYEYASIDSTRDHKYKASAEGMNIKESLKEMKGDALKTSILNDFKASLEGINDKAELSQKVAEFKKSDEYKILATGQGTTTRLLGLETSAVKALKEIVKDAETSIGYRNMSNP